MLIDCAPEPEFLSSAFHNDFVQKPNIAGARLPSPQVAGDLGSEPGDPTADRLTKCLSHARAALPQLHVGSGLNRRYARPREKRSVAQNGDA